MESRKMALMKLFAGQQWRHIENRLVDKGGGRKKSIGCVERVTGNILPYVK